MYRTTRVATEAGVPDGRVHSVPRPRGAGRLAPVIGLTVLLAILPGGDRLPASDIRGRAVDTDCAAIVDPVGRHLCELGIPSADELPDPHAFGIAIDDCDTSACGVQSTNDCRWNAFIGDCSVLTDPVERRLCELAILLDGDVNDAIAAGATAQVDQVSDALGHLPGPTGDAEEPRQPGDPNGFNIARSVLLFRPDTNPGDTTDDSFLYIGFDVSDLVDADGVPPSPFDADDNHSACIVAPELVGTISDDGPEGYAFELQTCFDVEAYDPVSFNTNDIGIDNDLALSSVKSLFIPLRTVVSPPIPADSILSFPTTDVLTNPTSGCIDQEVTFCGNGNDVEIIIKGVESLPAFGATPLIRRRGLGQLLARLSTSSAADGADEEYASTAFLFPAPSMEVSQQVRCVDCADPIFSTNAVAHAPSIVEYEIVIKNTGNRDIDVALLEILAALGDNTNIINCLPVTGTLSVQLHRDDAVIDITIANSSDYGLYPFFFIDHPLVPNLGFLGAIRSNDEIRLGILRGGTVTRIGGECELTEGDLLSIRFQAMAEVGCIGIALNPSPAPDCIGQISATAWVRPPYPPSTGNYCENDEWCDDGVYCNGPEYCLNNFCEMGIHPCESITMNCDELMDTCGPPIADSNGAIDTIDEFAMSRDDNGASVDIQLAFDCNANLFADECDISGGTDVDCNDNLIPDECDKAEPEVSVTWVAGNGAWNDPGNWCPTIVPNNNGGQVFDVDFSTNAVTTTLDLDVEIRSLATQSGTVVEVNASSGADRSIDVLESVTHNGRLRVTDARSFSIGASTSIVGGALQALSGGQMRLDGASGQGVSVEVDGGGGVIAGKGGKLGQSSLQLVRVIDGQSYFFEGRNLNNGAVEVHALTNPTALRPSASQDALRMAGPGVLSLSEVPTQPLATAVFGDSVSDLVNSNGHTIEGVGYVEGRIIDNRGTVRALKVGNRRLRLLAAVFANTGRLEADTNASILAIGDIVSRGLDGRVELAQGAKVDVFGAISLIDGASYGASTSNGSEDGVLTADSLDIVTTNQAAGTSLMELSGEMAAIIASGVKVCDPPCDTRDCWDCRVQIRALSLLESGGMSIAQDGVLGVSDQASVGIEGLLAVASGGSLVVSDQALLSVDGDFALADGGTLAVGSSLAVALRGNFTNESTVFEIFDWSGGALALVGGADAQTFEVAGRDVGARLCGLVGNFKIGRLTVGRGAKVLFEDIVDNDGAGGGPCTEALYVGTLVLEAGATITLDGCRVYYQELIDNGATMNAVGCGELRQIPGDLNLDSVVNAADYPGLAGCTLGPNVAPLDAGCSAADFDADGDVDLRDVAAFMVALGEPVWDADCDGDADLADYAVFAACQLGPDAPYGGELCRLFDHDHDGDVDLLDAAALLRLTRP